MIRSLTEKQKAMLPEYSKEWIKIGLSTKRADRKRCEKAYKDLYRLSNLKEPKVFWLPSPFCAALASCAYAHAMALIFGRQTENQKNAISTVDSTVGSAVRSAVDSAVGSTVGSTVGSAVGSAVGSTVRSAVGSAVDLTVDSTVRSAVGSAVGSTVRSAVGSAVDSTVRSAVGSTVRSAVGSAVGSTVRSAVDSTVDSTVGSAVRSAVGSTVGSAVGSTVRSAVDSTVDSAVHELDAKTRLLISNAMSGAGYSYFGGSLWCWWSAYFSFMEEVLGVDITEIGRAYRETQKNGGYFWTLDRVVFASDRPMEIHQNPRWALHRDGGMAISYSDGWGLYRLNGVDVPREYVMTEAEKMDPEMVLKEQNVERRRELLRKIGIERFVQKCGARALDRHGDYELLLIELPDMPKMKYLKMLNPSIGVWHCEGVHPECQTVQQAINWRAGNIKENWNPLVLT